MPAPQAQHKFALQTPQMVMRKNRPQLVTRPARVTRHYSSFEPEAPNLGIKDTSSTKNKAVYKEAQAKQQEA